MSKLLRNDNIIGCLLAAMTLCVYLKTLAPTVGLYDCGELAAAAATLGIPHPTGYPLFTLLGHVFSKLPLGGTLIWKMNLFSALLCAAAVFCFYRLFLFLLSHEAAKGFGMARISALPGKAAKTHAGDSALLQAADRIAAAAAALVLAFSRTYWSQSPSIEVYALHIFFLGLVPWLYLRALFQDARAPDGTPPNPSWHLFAFVLGLSFTNHMTMILLAPAFLYLFFSVHGFSRKAGTRIVAAALPFIGGLSLYLYLPLRAAQRPLVNWGNPATFEAFWRHVSAEQYQFGMFSSLEITATQSKKFFPGLLSEFGYAPLLFAVPALIYLYRRGRKLLVFSVLLFLGCLVYSLNYDFHDTNSFFMLCYVAAAIWVLVGVRLFLERTAFRSSERNAARAVCAGLFLFPLGLNYAFVDESRNYIIEDYTKNVFASLEPNAVIFSRQSGYFNFAADFYQLTEGLRRDVVIVDGELLFHEWYPNQLDVRYPGLVTESRPELEAFGRALKKLHRGEGAGAEDPEYRMAFLRAFQALVRDCFKTRPVYVTWDIDPEYLGGYERIPAGLAFRLFPQIPEQAIPPMTFNFHPIPDNRPYHGVIRSNYAAAYVNQGIYGVMMLGDTATGIDMVRKALEVEPGNQSALDFLRKYGSRP